MYIWKLRDVVAAEGSPAEMIVKAKRASLSALWVKVADGTSHYANVRDDVARDFRELIRLAHDNGIEIWGWQVPHCASTAIAKKEAKLLGDLVEAFGLDGMIMDAEGTSAYFHGDVRQRRLTALRCGKLRTISENRLECPATTFRKISTAGCPSSTRSPGRRPIQLPANLLWRQSQRHPPRRSCGHGQCTFDDSVRPGRRGLYRDRRRRLRFGVGLRRARPGIHSAVQRPELPGLLILALGRSPDDIVGGVEHRSSLTSPADRSTGRETISFRTIGRRVISRPLRVSPPCGNTLCRSHRNIRGRVG